MNRNGRHSPTQGVRQGLGGLLHDVITLAELQLQLLMIDAGASVRRAIVPTALIGAAGVFGLSALPLLLLAVAQLLRDQAGWPAALATLTAVLIGLVIAGILALLGYLGLRRTFEPLSRSRDELSRNIHWLKTALQRQELHANTAATAAPADLVRRSPR